VLPALRRLAAPHIAVHERANLPRNSPAVNAAEAVAFEQSIDAVKKNYPLY
jgi:hypothetical protein